MQHLSESQKMADRPGPGISGQAYCRGKSEKEELETWYKESGLPLKRFFNTSGNKYKELHLKDRLSSMTEEEQLELLATDGMLVKRPVLVGEDFVVTGFKEKEWREKLGLSEE